ncbi:peroxiredoxin-like family protein [Pseudoalteromonas fenneropenaei]|uniref:thioredoxin-dependent peroxiredoxin n=1 Tax=Pseudoalteromonas fenneropenaei TaxID=1737459 RepID=A0ABV7CLS9_9GAMM
MRLFHVVVATLFCLISPLTVAASATNIFDAPEQVSPLLPGLSLPAATLKNSQNESITIKTLTEGKLSVLVVYRGGWCPYCSRQLAGLQKLEAKLAALNAQVIAISPDAPEQLAKSTIPNPFYTLLSDDSLAFSQALGLAYYLDDKTALAYRNKMGVNFVALDGTEKVALPVPAVFVVDKNGLVQFQYANPNYKVRLNEAVLLAAVQAASEI